MVAFDLSAVPVIDATGLVSLESAMERLRVLGVFVVLAGVREQPLRVLARSGLRTRHREFLAVYRSMERAFAVARKSLGGGAARPA